MKIEYEVFIDDGITDVITFDDLKKARAEADDWAKRSGKPISINKVTTETIETHSTKCYMVNILNDEGKPVSTLTDGKNYLMTYARAKQVMEAYQGPEQCRIKKSNLVKEAR